MTANSINQHYGEDHERLHALFHQFQSLKTTNKSGARQAFHRFKSGLEQHIRCEERILFPCFDQRRQSQGFSPTLILRREHEQILFHLEEMARKLARDDFGTDEEEQNLLTVLSFHNQTEEETVYPVLDQILTDQERTAVFAAMTGRR